MTHQNIPQELKDKKQWVNWHVVDRNGKLAKPPLNPTTGEMARCDDPNTWGTFEQALTLSKDNIGFQLQPPYVAVDLDKCRNASTGHVESWATDIVKSLNSYTEISPSGNGLHIFVRGKLPTGPRRSGKIEMYDSGRYITITGNLLNGNATIEERPTEILSVYQNTFSGKRTQVDLADYNGDHSAADLAFCNKLANETNGDPVKMDQLFRESELWRPKWDEKHYSSGQTYGEHTIQKALDKYQRPSDLEILSAEDILSTEYPPLKFLIGPKLLPKGGKMVLTAENGTGKSAVALYTAACLATGKNWFGFEETHKDTNFGEGKFPVNGGNRVLYIDYEIPHSIRKEMRLEPLVKSFGSGFTKNLIFAKHPTRYRLEASDFKELSALVEDTHPDVLIIDPLSSAHNQDENTSAMLGPLGRLSELTDEFGCAVILPHHTSTKKFRSMLTGDEKEKGAKEQSRGWSGITDWCDFNLLLTDKTQGKTSDKLLELRFAKTRYNHKVPRRYILANIGEMTFQPGQKPPKSKEEDDD